MNLQCNTPYDARLRAVCTPAAASSDWMAFPAFRTANAGGGGSSERMLHVQPTAIPKSTQQFSNTYKALQNIWFLGFSTNNLLSPWVSAFQSAEALAFAPPTRRSCCAAHRAPRLLWRFPSSRGPGAKAQLVETSGRKWCCIFCQRCRNSKYMYNYITCP